MSYHVAGLAGLGALDLTVDANMQPIRDWFGGYYGGQLSSFAASDAADNVCRSGYLRKSATVQASSNTGRIDNAKIVCVPAVLASGGKYCGDDAYLHRRKPLRRHHRSRSLPRLRRQARSRRRRHRPSPASAVSVSSPASA